VPHSASSEPVSGRMPRPARSASAPTTSRAQRNREMFERYRDPGGCVDRDTLIERFLPLARQIARRYQRPEEPFDDIFQVACFGLVKAVDRFDVTRGIAFSSCAVPTIHGEIKRHFRDRTWAVRVPRDLQDLSLRVERVVGELTRDLGQQPSVDDVALALGVEPEAVLEAMQASSAYRATSLDMPRGGGHEEPGTTLGDTIGRTEEGFDRAEQRALLSELMCSLTLRERNVIRLRFELDLTQAQIGERIGVSQMQVSRILRQSVARMRTIANARERDDTAA
jgi:RNA polymerase sigma-B factor